MVQERDKVRVGIEKLIGQAKKWRDSGRARYWGLWRVGVQGIMIFFVINPLTKRAGPGVKWRKRRGKGKEEGGKEVKRRENPRGL